MLNKSKIVVFDMDETMGYFLELGIFWDSLQLFLNKKQNKEIKQIKMNQEYFNKILDLYPEFIRPNIFTVLTYLKKKVIKNNCNGVMIYTNNQGSREWVYLIKNYYEFKLNYKLFSNIICAYKINEDYTELCRTTHNKTHKDFINCTMISENTQICFLDDMYHSDMHNDNVYYIKVNPYTHNLGFNEMLNRFLKSELGSTILSIVKSEKELFFKFMKNEMEQYHFIYLKKNKEEYELDKIVTKKIMIHLQNFFKKKYIIPTPPPQHPSSLYNKSETIKNKNKNKNMSVNNKTRKIKK